jgi:hypothetical protein
MNPLIVGVMLSNYGDELMIPTSDTKLFRLLRERLFSAIYG